MTEQKRAIDMRAAMPETARWIEQMRADWGREHVNGCIRRALAGEAGEFYAIEAGHVLGTPFPSTHPIADAQNWAVMCGSGFAGFMREPVAVALGEAP